MDIISIDLGKKNSYVVVEKDGSVIKEGYTVTTKEGFSKFFSIVDRPTVIAESSCTLDRAATIIEESSPESNIVIAHPMKVKIISESVNKTDKNDAHTLLDMYKAKYLPESYLPEKKVRDERNLCRNRNFLVRQRTAIKNRIHDQAYRLGIDLKSFTKKTLIDLSNASLPLKVLIEQLKSTNMQIKVLNAEINAECNANANASFIDSIPGIGPYSALGIASEIGDIERFRSVENLWSYAGLIPKTHQSGSKEWKGHIIKGNVFLKYLLIEVVQIHILKCPYSPVTFAYQRVKARTGSKKARIAAARHLLRIIYCLLKDQRNYRP